MYLTLAEVQNAVSEWMKRRVVPEIKPEQVNIFLYNAATGEHLSLANVAVGVAVMNVDMPVVDKEPYR
jgi:hypothetical protein